MENLGYENDGPGTVTHRKIPKEGSEDDYGLRSLRGGGSNVSGSEVKAEGENGVFPKEGSLEGGQPAANDPVNLQRRVGLLSGIALIVGTMIGSGIFVSPKGVLERSGSAGLSLVIWFACGLLSLLGALCYVELGCLIPSSGAEHTYFLAAFGHLPSFLFAWVTIVVLKPAMLAIICLSFSKYLVEAFVVECDPPEIAIQMLGALTIGALAYAELGTLIEDSGGEYSYFLEVTGTKEERENSFWRPLPSFLFSWVSVFLLRPAQLAIISLTSAEYLIRLLLLGCDPNLTQFSVDFSFSIKLIAVSIMIIITFINSFSVNLATKVQNVFTAAKLLAVAVIVIGGMVKLGQGNVQYINQGFEGSTTKFGDIATAFYSGLWAYDGWNNLNYVTEELKKPYTNLPRSIIIGLPLVTLCYILINISYLAVMSTDELLASETVAVLYGQRLIGPFGEIILILAVAMSTFGAANGSCFTAGRLCFVAAREGHMVDVLSYVHAKKLTPSPALLFNALIAILMVIPSDIGSLIDFFSFTAWIFYGGAMLALIIMRRTKKDVHRPYKVPIIIPWIVLLFSVYLVVGPIIDQPQIEYLYATMFIVAGLFFYVPFVYMKKSVPGMGHLTTFFQLLLEVVPTDKIPDP